MKELSPIRRESEVDKEELKSMLIESLSVKIEISESGNVEICLYFDGELLTCSDEYLPK